MSPCPNPTSTAISSAAGGSAESEREEDASVRPPLPLLMPTQRRAMRWGRGEREDKREIGETGLTHGLCLSDPRYSADSVPRKRLNTSYEELGLRCYN